MLSSASDHTATRSPFARLGRSEILLLAAWCGAAGGLLEVATRIVCRAINPTNRLYLMTRHFVWLALLSNLLFFSVAGLGLALAARLWPRWGAWLSTRIICVGAILPTLVVSNRQIYEFAWLILACGIAIRLAPLLERDSRRLRALLLITSPVLLGIILATSGFVFGMDWLKARLEATRPLPPPGSPNVLLVVMDTVRADRLSLYGYERPTTPTLERLAKRGIRFDNVVPRPRGLCPHTAAFSPAAGPMNSEWNG